MRYLFILLSLTLLFGCGGETKSGSDIKPGVYINNNIVLFVFKAEDNTKVSNVAIYGDFNGWDPKGIPLKFENGVWKIFLQLDDGIYQYKYIINNKDFIRDPYGLASAPDGKGGRNSVVEIISKKKSKEENK